MSKKPRPTKRINRRDVGLDQPESPDTMPSRDEVLARDDVPTPDPTEVATRLTSVATQLLRRLRREDAAFGVSSARLSALSVLVYRGPRTLGSLALSEAVTPPSMTRLITAMERDGLAERAHDHADRRKVTVRATPAGERLLLRGREQRVGALATWLSRADPDELEQLAAATTMLERLLIAQRS